MAKAHLVAHDVGTGDPAMRIRDAGVLARVAGENVAAASSLAHAHRALWGSPSHHGNLLSTELSRIGVGVFVLRTA